MNIFEERKKKNSALSLAGGKVIFHLSAGGWWGYVARMDASGQEPAGIEKRNTALHERQAARRAELDTHRADLYARQFRERGALREMQAAGKEGVEASRTERQPKGLAALLTRITGVGRLV